MAHAPRNMIAARANTRVLHLVIIFFVVHFVDIACFTESSSSLCARVVACNLQIHGRAHVGPAAKPFVFSIKFSKSIYFQLQLGCVLPPLKVNCLTLVPSASMVQI